MGRLFLPSYFIVLALLASMTSVGDGLPCPHCKAKLPSQNALDWHLDQSAACRVVRAMNAAEAEAGIVQPTVFDFDDNDFLPPAGPFYDETAELIIEDDDEMLLPADDEQEVREMGAGDGGAGPGTARQFDSAFETALWINTAGVGGTKLPNRSRDEWLKLMKDERYRLEECLAKWKSHRDMDLTIMKAAVGNGSRIVNLQRKDKDPEPILLSYIPALDLIKEMFADVKNKKGFVLRPQVKIKEIRRGEDGNVVVIKEYDHPSTGSFWDNAQDEVDNDKEFVGEHIIIPIIVYLDKTTLDGLGRVSAYPLYISLANFSWEVYNQRNGMQLCALLPSVRADADWGPLGYKPNSEGFKETRRYFMHRSLSILFESARKASFTGTAVTDPHGVHHNAVPFLFVISKDLGEASAISGVLSSFCDSCLVPRKELNLVTEANRHGYPARLEDEMWCVYQQMAELRKAGAPRVRITELSREHGIHFVEPWFWDWNYKDRPWNNVYRKMAPDDLHTVFGGLLGHHFVAVIGAVGSALPMGQAAFLSDMDVRLHQVYLKYRPSGLRLPAKKDFFTHPCSTPAYEWKAVLQVLPLMVVGICKIGGRDVLAEWAVAFCEWVKSTFWTEDGQHDDDSLQRSDELLAVFEQKSRAIAGFQLSRWCFRKMHETSKFTDFIRRCGSPRWFSTERGERRHHWVKKWWKEMNGKDITKSLFKSWNNALAIESVEAQRAELAELQKRDVYDSAAMDALNANEEGGENRLNKTELFTIYLPNLLVSPEESDNFTGVSGRWEQRRVLIQWLRLIPHLKELPEALAMFFAAQDQLTPAEVRGLNIMSYLDDKITDRIHVVNSCYVVPHEGGRDRLRQARASADYHGSVVLSDLATASDTPEHPTDHTWYGKAHMFFRVFQRKTVWDNNLRKRVSVKEPVELVFLRWYNETGYRDATNCPQLEWAVQPGRPAEAPFCAVISVDSIKSVEMMVPKYTMTHGKRLVYRTLYFR